MARCVHGKLCQLNLIYRYHQL